MSSKPKSLEMISCLFYDLPESGEADLETIASEMEDPIEDVIAALDDLQKMGAVKVAINGLTITVQRKDGSRISYANYSWTFSLNSW
jgi:hypothetical protein